MKIMNPITRYILPGIAISAAFTIIIAATSLNLTELEIIAGLSPLPMPGG